MDEFTLFNGNLKPFDQPPTRALSLFSFTKKQKWEEKRELWVFQTEQERDWDRKRELELKNSQNGTDTRTGLRKFLK